MLIGLLMMNRENLKDLVVGMLFGLAMTLDCTFTDQQQEVFDKAKKIIDEIYYKRDEENDK